jgi:hypothetical protein
MSKYRGLTEYLDHAIGAQCPMTFKAVEVVLGFPLPKSARRHAAWWANTGGGHVHAQAWLKPGWKTSRVDLAKESVMFVREIAVDAAVVANAMGEWEPVFHMSAFSPAVARLLHETAGVEGNLGEAAETLMRESVRARRKALMDWFKEHSSVTTSDSVDLIREDRDGR